MRHEVNFYWDDRDGFCEGCGLPAAFYSVNAFGVGKHMKLCAVCAANEACDGATIARIDPERCPECGQPDNCGDCDHTPLSPEQMEFLSGNSLTA